MIAKSFCCWLYSMLPVMKARSLILRALLFAVVLAPSALWASARSLGAPSCTVLKPQVRQVRTGWAGVKTVRTPDQLMAAMPGHHSPAPRLHRIRGKKISMQRGFASAPRCYARMVFLFSAESIAEQEIGGPNPSRGPPSQFSI
jgi:hypothetical protein